MSSDVIQRAFTSPTCWPTTAGIKALQIWNTSKEESGEDWRWYRRSFLSNGISCVMNLVCLVFLQERAENFAAYENRTVRLKLPILSRNDWKRQRQSFKPTLASPLAFSFNRFTDRGRKWSWTVSCSWVVTTLIATLKYFSDPIRTSSGSQRLCLRDKWSFMHFIFSSPIGLHRGYTYICVCVCQRTTFCISMCKQTFFISSSLHPWVFVGFFPAIPLPPPRAFPHTPTHMRSVCMYACHTGMSETASVTGLTSGLQTSRTSRRMERSRCEPSLIPACIILLSIYEYIWSSIWSRNILSITSV